MKIIVVYEFDCPNETEQSIQDSIENLPRLSKLEKVLPIQCKGIQRYIRYEN
jgi:hypothetical protein